MEPLICMRSKTQDERSSAVKKDFVSVVLDSIHTTNGCMLCHLADADPAPVTNSCSLVAVCARTRLDIEADACGRWALQL